MSLFNNLFGFTPRTSGPASDNNHNQPIIVKSEQDIRALSKKAIEIESRFEKKIEEISLLAEKINARQDRIEKNQRILQETRKNITEADAKLEKYAEMRRRIAEKRAQLEADAKNGIKG